MLKLLEVDIMEIAPWPHFLQILNIKGVLTGLDFSSYPCLAVLIEKHVAICDFNQADFLFPISHFVDFETGGRLLFIIDYAELKVFLAKTTEITKKTESHANKRAWHIEMALMKVKAVGF